MNDTDPKVAAMVSAHYAPMTPIERLEIASSMYDTARAIVESSLPQNLSREERRYQVATGRPRRHEPPKADPQGEDLLDPSNRIYRDEVPEAALRPHTRHRD